MQEESYFPFIITRVKNWSKTAGFRRYFKNTSWSMGAKIASLAVSLLVSIYSARYLGPANYGELSYAVSFVGIFAFIASLGIDSVLYRDLVKHPEQRNEYMGSALVLKLVAGAGATII